MEVHLFSFSPSKAVPPSSGIMPQCLLSEFTNRLLWNRAWSFSLPWPLHIRLISWVLDATVTPIFSLSPSKACWLSLTVLMEYPAMKVCLRTTSCCGVRSVPWSFSGLRAPPSQPEISLRDGAFCASWQVLGEANIPLFSWGKQTNQMWEALRMTVEQKPGDVPHQLPVRDSIAGRCWGFRPWAGSSCCCSVFPLPVCWYSVADASGTCCRPAAAFYFIFCQGMQSVVIRPVFGAGDPCS